jgi:hypothetical protein
VRGEGPHLGQHAFDHEARRHHALLLAQGQSLQHLVELAAGLAQARQVVLGAARIGDAMLVDEELGRLALHAEQLVDRVVVKAKAFAFELVFQEPGENARGQLLRRRLPRQVVGLQVGQVAALGREIALDLGDGGIVEVGVVAAVAELLGDPNDVSSSGCSSTNVIKAFS